MLAPHHQLGRRSQKLSPSDSAENKTDRGFTGGERQGRTQMEEEIAALAEMSRPASLFPSSLSAADSRALSLMGMPACFERQHLRPLTFQPLSPPPSRPEMPL